MFDLVTIKRHVSIDGQNQEIFKKYLTIRVNIYEIA